MPWPEVISHLSCFNEAAGFTRRKPPTSWRGEAPRGSRFNEAAGFTRRKPISKVLIQTKSLSFNEAAGFTRRKRGLVAVRGGQVRASMRPPDLPGGNSSNAGASARVGRSFNEAAGFTRRKHGGGRGAQVAQHPQASMRPPDLPGGNTSEPPSQHLRHPGFNEAAGFTRRKPVLVVHVALATIASMRPPDLPGGNTVAGRAPGTVDVLIASMRPPDLPGGNSCAQVSDKFKQAVLQ